MHKCPLSWPKINKKSHAKILVIVHKFICHKGNIPPLHELHSKCPQFSDDSLKHHDFSNIGGTPFDFAQIVEIETIKFLQENEIPAYKNIFCI